MESGRPLREAFAELLNDESARSAYATDPDGFLGAYGHGDLPGSLVAEAIVNFADSASPAVAEHLAPYVIAQSGAAEPGDVAAAPGFGLDLLATAPAELELDEPLVDDAGAVPGLPVQHPDLAPTGAEPGIDGGEHAAAPGDHPSGAGGHPVEAVEHTADLSDHTPEVSDHTAEVSAHTADLDFGTGADWFTAVPEYDASLDDGADLDPAAGLDAIPDQADVDQTGLEPATGPLDLSGAESPDQPADDAADGQDGSDGPDGG